MAFDLTDDLAPVYRFPCGACKMVSDLFSLGVEEIGFGGFESPFVLGRILFLGLAYVNLNAFGFGGECELLVGRDLDARGYCRSGGSRR